MTNVRLAVIGAGMMAARRTRAFLATERVTVCAVVSRTLEHAQRLGARVGCARCFDDVERLPDTRPDAVLIEVPHRVQDGLTFWALERGLHALVGGCLASSLESGLRIRDLARDRGLVVEAGYEARYKPVWETARGWIERGEIGLPVAIRSVALFPTDTRSWYYSESESGGMPLTHMTYAFLNPARWLFGEPLAVSAFANRIVETAPDRVGEETCTANLLFERDLVCNMTAGYVAPGGTFWSFTVIGSRGVLDIHPSDAGAGEFFLHRGEVVEHRAFDGAADPFVRQAHAFLDALAGRATCRNTPEATLGDLFAADAIVRSARQRRTIELSAADASALLPRPAPAPRA